MQTIELGHAEKNLVMQVRLVVRSLGDNCPDPLLNKVAAAS